MSYLTVNKKTKRVEMYSNDLIQVSEKFDCIPYTLTQQDLNMLRTNLYDVYCQDGKLTFQQNDAYLADQKKISIKATIDKIKNSTTIKKDDLLEILNLLTE